MNIAKEVYELHYRPTDTELNSGEFICINIDEDKEKISENIDNIVNKITATTKYTYFYSPIVDKVRKLEDKNVDIIKTADILHEKKSKSVIKELDRKLTIKILKAEKIRNNFLKIWVNKYFNEKNPRKLQESNMQCRNIGSGIYVYSFRL